MQRGLAINRTAARIEPIPMVAVGSNRQTARFRMDSALLSHRSPPLLLLRRRQSTAMSDCRAIDCSQGGRGNGFVVKPWRAPFLAPDPDNVFLLLGCRASSPLFQGFPDRHLPCRNVSGMGCGDYYSCPAWDDYYDGQRRPSGAAYGTAVSWGAIRAVNVSRLQCEGAILMATKMACSLNTLRNWSDMDSRNKM